MFVADGLLGCPFGVQNILEHQNKLSWKVVERINESQELTMMNVFCHQSNESFLKKCVEQRIAEIKSWHWVLKDLSKRLDEATGGLKYEENAVQVIIDRLKDEIEVHSHDVTMPGALCPFSDPVEESIFEENKYLKEQRKLFEQTLQELQRQIVLIQKIKKKIDSDALRKQKSIDIDEKVTEDPENLSNVSLSTNGKKKNRASPLSRWEKKCANLKSLGIQALTNAVVLRLQIRGARTRLSIGAQANSCRVDVVLKRRLHANRVKLEELAWQRNEILKDLKILDEELLGTEKALTDNLNTIRKVEAKMIERSLKPSGEHTSDDVNKSMRIEIASLRKFIKDLRGNIKRINSLKITLIKAVTKIDSYIEDLTPVINLDARRIKGRLGEVHSVPRSSASSGSVQTGALAVQPSASFLEEIGDDNGVSSGPYSPRNVPLPVIREEDESDLENLDDEEDDYPFDF